MWRKRNCRARFSHLAPPPRASCSWQGADPYFHRTSAVARSRRRNLERNHVRRPVTRDPELIDGGGRRSGPLVMDARVLIGRGVELLLRNRDAARRGYRAPLVA